MLELLLASHYRNDSSLDLKCSFLDMLLMDEKVNRLKRVLLIDQIIYINWKT